MKHLLIAVSFGLLAASPLCAQHAGHHGKHAPSAAPPAQPYAGQQQRVVTSLSADEVQAYLEGRGMGLAKPAELLGFPGPMHVLELDQQLKLSDDQRAKVKSAMDKVKARVRDLGRQYVDAEAAVDEAFRANAGEAAIAARVSAAGKLHADIRMAHLAAHIEITPLLSAEQRKLYAQLRGYDGGGAGHGGHGAHKKH